MFRQRHKRLLLLGLAFLSMGVLGWSLWSGYNRARQPQRLLARAIRLLEGGEAEGSLDQYERALRLAQAPAERLVPFYLVRADLADARAGAELRWDKSPPLLTPDCLAPMRRFAATHPAEPRTRLLVVRLLLEFARLRSDAPIAAEARDLLQRLAAALPADNADAAVDTARLELARLYRRTDRARDAETLLLDLRRERTAGLRARRRAAHPRAVPVLPQMGPGGRCRAGLDPLRGGGTRQPHRAGIALR